MTEYINRQALLAEYDRVHVGPPGGAKKLIEEAPAADVAPVVHGRWEFVADEYCSTAHCSNCGKGQGLYINGRKPEWNYCPNCGARMDGE